MTTSLQDHSQRAHALLSASSAHRWLACPPSAVAAELYPQQDTEYTQEGALAHEVAECIASAGSLPHPIRFDRANWPPAEVTQEMVECAEAYRDYIQEQIRTADATVLLERRVDFSPWVPDGFGTADCIILQGDTMDVIDYKYGAGVQVSAVENEQERLYALGALNDYGLAYDIAKVRTHIFQPRMNNISVEELTADDLLAWGESIKPTAQLAADGEGEYQPGDHCKFCPHAGQCRALTDACTRTVRTHKLQATVPVLMPYEVAEVLQLEPLISLWLKRVREQAMTTMMDGGEIPGYKVVAGRGTRTWKMDGDVAEVLEAAGYSMEEYTKTELLSPAQMEKALGKKKVADLLADHIETKVGAPTIAPETDKRPAYDRVAEAKKDFEE